MAREQTNPQEKHWANYHAQATHTIKTLHVYEWTCPDCKTVNRTRIDTAEERHRYRCYRGVETRCGKCHGNLLRLTDATGLTFDPYA